MKKNITYYLSLLAFLISFNVQSQNFYVTSGSLAQTTIDSCSSTVVTVNTFLGCINWVQGPSSYTVSGSIIRVRVNCTSSPICQGAISNPVYTETLQNLSPGTYSVRGVPYLDNVKGTAVSLGTLTVTSCIATGVKDVQATERFNVYPNPTTNYITIENFSGSKEYFQIFDLSGREALNGLVQQNTSQVDLSSLSPGVYFMKYEFGNEEFVQKIIVQ